jgi:hypothetical protein
MPRRRVRPSVDSGGQQLAFDFGSGGQEAVGDEPLRPAADAPDAAERPGEVREPARPRPALHDSGRAAGGRDRAARAVDRGTGSAGGDLSGEGRPAEHGAAGGRCPGAGCAGPPRSSSSRSGSGPGSGMGGWYPGVGCAGPPRSSSSRSGSGWPWTDVVASVTAPDPGSPRKASSSTSPCVICRSSPNSPSRRRNSIA